VAKPKIDDFNLDLDDDFFTQILSKNNQTAQNLCNGVLGGQSKTDSNLTS